jgi:NADH-quinone oxidoreductase subunit E
VEPISQYLYAGINSLERNFPSYQYARTLLKKEALMAKSADPVLRTQEPVETTKGISPGTAPQGESSPCDNILRAIELLSEYYSLSVNDPALGEELTSLLGDAAKRGAAEKKVMWLKKLVEELRGVDEIIDKHHGDKEALIQILLDINEQRHWLPKTSLHWLSVRLGVPLTQIYHIGSFYKVFSLVPQGRHIVQVCLGTACQVRGAPRLLDRALLALNIAGPGTDKAQKFSLRTVNCLGCCALGPVMVIDDDHYGNPSPEKLKQILDKYD